MQREKITEMGTYVYLHGRKNIKVHLYLSRDGYSTVLYTVQAYFFFPTISVQGYVLVDDVIFDRTIFFTILRALFLPVKLEYSFSYMSDGAEIEIDDLRSSISISAIHLNRNFLHQSNRYQLQIPSI